MQTLRERAPLHGASRPAVPEGVVIDVVDAAPFIHYPASVADLRGVLALLPAGVADGLGAIEFSLGPEWQSALDGEADPWTGRRSVELAPGVYEAASALGVYLRPNATVRLFAYVYERSRRNLDIVGPYLQLRMLATFVHEMAHHQDQMLRVARGRWLGDDVAHAESYAEALELDWVNSAVLPYLQSAHGAAIDRLAAWVRERAGAGVSLDSLVWDSRYEVDAEEIRLALVVDQAFAALIEDC